MAKRRLILECLEDRLTPSTGALWPDPLHLTLSFVPDGTYAANGSSNLFSSMASQGPPAVWEQTILRAFQTWAVNSNINIGVVPDDGSPLGTPGADEGDPRFGDIRIAAQPLPSTAVATTAFYQPGSTWSGDMILNSNFSFGTRSGQYNLFTVALHEAGHVFNLVDSTDTKSVMYTQYRGAYTGLLADDVPLLQSVYGARTPDTQNNRSIMSASDLQAVPGAPTGSPLTVLADLSSNQQSDFYHFRTDHSVTAAAGVDVLLHSAGLSLFTGKLTVYDRSGKVIGSAVATDPLHNDVLLHLSRIQANSDYYVSVQGAASNVFGIGSYQLTVNLHPQSVTNSNPLHGAQDLYSPGGAAATAPLVASGSITVTDTSDVYRFKTQNKATYAAGANITVEAWGAGISPPTLTVYDKSGTILATGTAKSSVGGYVSLHLTRVAANTEYYVRVQSNAQDSSSIGAYTLQVDLYPNVNGQPLNAAALLVTGGSPNNTIGNASNLQSINGFVQQTRYEAIGSLVSSTDSDFYHIKSVQLGNNQTSVLTVTVLAQNSQTLNPVVTVYDNSNNVVAATVLTNDNGVFVVEVPNAAANADYYVQVSAGAGSATGGGNYFLKVADYLEQAVALTSIADGTLSASVPQQSGSLKTTQNQLFNFVLSAESSTTAAGASVQMNIYGSTGALVFSLIAGAGQPPTSSMVFLSAGTYTVTYTAVAPTGATLATLNYSLSGQVLSQQIGPTPINPTTTTSSGSTTSSSGTTTSSLDTSGWFWTYLSLSPIAPTTTTTTL